MNTNSVPRRLPILEDFISEKLATIGQNQKAVNYIYHTLIKIFRIKKDLALLRTLIEQLEYDVGSGDFSQDQDAFSKIVKIIGRSSKDVYDMLVTTMFASSLFEAKPVKVKRKWTDNYPQVNINPEAILRNKIVEFIKLKIKQKL